MKQDEGEVLSPSKFGKISLKKQGARARTLSEKEKSRFKARVRVLLEKPKNMCGARSGVLVKTMVIFIKTHRSDGFETSPKTGSSEPEIYSFFRENLKCGDDKPVE